MGNRRNFFNKRSNDAHNVGIFLADFRWKEKKIDFSVLRFSGAKLTVKLASGKSARKKTKNSISVFAKLRGEKGAISCHDCETMKKRESFS